MDRDFIRGLLSSIAADNVYITYHFDGEKLHVECEEGLLSRRQVDLVSRYRDQLIEYITTPPTAKGQCVHGHLIMWRCTRYGLWTCNCYFHPAPVKFVKPGAAKLTHYWDQTA